MPLKTPPQNYLWTLLALRDYYAPLVEQYEKLYKQALDNLNHVEALLANWPAKSREQTNRPPTEQAAVAVTAVEKGKDVSNGSEKILETKTNLAHPNTDLDSTDNVETEHLSVSEENTHTQLEIPQLNDTNLETASSYNSNGISEVETVLLKSNPTQQDSSLDSFDNTGQTQGEEEEFNDQQLPLTDTKQTDVSSVSPEDNGPASDESTTVAQEDITLDNGGNNTEIENALEASTDKVETQSTSTNPQNEHQQAQTADSHQESAEKTQGSLPSLSDVPMRDEYKELSRIEAVQKLLEKHPGNICHVDFVMRALYGELEPDIRKIIRVRVQSTLTQGKNSGRLFLVPGKPGYYTIDLKLLKSNRQSNSSNQEKNKNKKPSPQSKANAVPMMEEFEGKFIIDALTSLLQQNPGKVFNVTQVIEALYGELDPEEIKEVKTSVMNELSRGHRTGIFSRVSRST